MDGKKKCKRLCVVFANIKQRCFNPKNPDFSYYGGRGITMCDEWRNNYMSFQNWAMANGYDENAPPRKALIIVLTAWAAPSPFSPLRARYASKNSTSSGDSFSR